LLGQLQVKRNMNIDDILQSQVKPEPFAPGEPLFWDDPHIAEQMLKAHLAPHRDLASRRPETIQRSVDWLVAALGLHAGAALLDLGCGPGLYAARLAENGLRVTGVDYSRRSIEWARQAAHQQQMEIEYRYQDYLTLEDEGQYDAALLIYGDYCPLSPAQRRTLLGNVRRALKPNGYFVLDVTTRAHRQQHGRRNSWYAAEQGFGKPGPHLVLEAGFDYAEQSIFLDQAIVIEAGGQVSVYRMWFQDFTPETITRELAAGGFLVQSHWGDLTGRPYEADTEWIGVIAKKSGPA
jgi:SAM-dependent methyltransferase